MLEILATHTLWLDPGESADGMMEPIMAAPAMAGLKPARTINGIMVGPRAAAHPAADGMAMATQDAINMQNGKRKKPNRLKGLTNKATKWTSHRVMETTAAKPSDEQMARIMDALVMFFIMFANAICGARLITPIAKPAVMSTSRVS